MISSDYTQKVMEDLDALLADLQSTTSSHNRFLSKSTTQQNSQQGSNTGYVYQTADQSQRRSETPPPLPPPPQDLLETIPPPDQFGDQHVYEGRSGGVRQEKTSTSIGKFQGSSPQVYPPNPVGKPAPASAKPYTPGMSISNNLSELDQLLQDLNSSQFLAEVDKKHPPSAKTIPNGSGRAPPPVAPKPNRDRALNNATVDSLLDQLECAVPYTSHAYNDDNSFPPPPSDAGDQGGYPMATNIVNYSYLPETAKHIPPKEPQVASTATRELDDLMASLSEFKMAGNAPGGGTPSSASSQFTRSPSPGSEPNYAKPYKSRNLSQGGVSPTPVSSSAQVHMEEQMAERMEHHMQQHHGELESMLGDLQSNLDRQGVSAKTKGLCAACNKAVVGQVITALGKIWHIEHFICAHCKDPLGTQNFYERDGAAYCERDYHSIFAPRCFYCNGPIVDKCVTALNRTWHPEHFFCAQCGRPFGEDGFHEKDGKAYCRADYFEMFAPKCGGCGRPIMENYISALNRHWHPDCFACWECRIPFNGGSFFDHEGLPYCETHYHAKRGSLCAGCQKPITGRCITAMYKKFHPEHFVCAFCLKQLNKGTFKEQNDKPYCHPCFVKLFG
ncbi:hypothetical protein ACJMK2_012625 [Sinanodonta woodiana]|uniref:LIM zinc-binding domain-containing protein n=2 Tax=Sinanodonta woodiana TaxID=1069815 RepID=A0ABD3VBT9_SINWO